MARELRATHLGLAVTGTTCPGRCAGSKLASLTIMTSSSSLAGYGGDVKWRDRYSLTSRPLALGSDRAAGTMPPSRCLQTQTAPTTLCLLLSYKRAVVLNDGGLLPFLGFPSLSHRVAA